MNKSKLAIFIDSLFFSLIIFILSFGWINKLLKNAKFSIFVSNIISIISFFVILFFSLKKYNSKKFSLQENKTANFMKNFLIYCKENESKIFYEKLFNSKCISENIYETTNLLLYINIKTPLTANDFFVANNISLTKNKPLIFIHDALSPEFENLLKNSPNTYYLYSYSDLFAIMKNNNLYPTPIPKENEFKLKDLKSNLQQKLTNVLTKDKFKNFCISGISLVIFSIFVPYSILYLISGSVLLICSIICLVNKNNKPKTLCPPQIEDIKK